MSYLDEYSVQRNLNGSFFMGNRWTVLWCGRDWMDCFESQIPLSLKESSTRWGAIRKAKKAARRRAQRPEVHRLSSTPIPRDDFRSVSR